MIQTILRDKCFKFFPRITFFGKYASLFTLCTLTIQNVIRNFVETTSSKLEATWRKLKENSSIPYYSMILKFKGTSSPLPKQSNAISNKAFWYRLNTDLFQVKRGFNAQKRPFNVKHFFFTCRCTLNAFARLCVRLNKDTFFTT